MSGGQDKKQSLSNKRVIVEHLTVAHLRAPLEQRQLTVAQLAKQAREALLLHVAQARGRLVEQKQHRIDAQRPRNLDDALLAERERSGRLIDLAGKADPLDLARGLRKQPCFIGAIEPEHEIDVASRGLAQTREPVLVADRVVRCPSHLGKAGSELGDQARQRHLLAVDRA